MKAYAYRFLLLLNLFSLLLVSLMGSMVGQAHTLIQSDTELQSQPGDSPVRLLSEDEDELILELDTQRFDLAEINYLSDEPGKVGVCQILSVEGYASTDRAGAPQLPVAGALVGIPADAQVELVVLEAEETTVSGTYHLCPVATPQALGIDPLVQDTEAGLVPEFTGKTLMRDPQVYGMDRFEPQQPAELVETGFVRSQRVARVRFQPFQYNPVKGELRHYRRIRVALRFSVEAWKQSLKLSPTMSDEGPFESLLSSSLLNYEQARAWRSLPAPVLPSEINPASSEVVNFQFKILVDQDGIYTITYADLEALGVDPHNFYPENFRLFNKGVELAILVIGEADGTFDSEDYILFYGQGVDTKYTPDNVYFLQANTEPTFPSGKRMAQYTANPNGAVVPSYFKTQQHFEKNTIYFSNFPSGPDKDTWYWSYVYAIGAPASTTLTVTLLNIEPTAPISVTLRGLLKGYAATPQHHTLLYVNGHLVDNAVWAAHAEYAFDIDIPGSYLLEGVNQIKLECPMDNGITTDVPLINYYELIYADRYAAEDDKLVFEGQLEGQIEFRVNNFSTPDLELYDITSTSNVSRLSGFQVNTSAANTMQIGYELVFGQNAFIPVRRFFAQTLGKRLSAKQILLDTPSNLRDLSNGSDYIIITHPDFAASLQALADHRTSQGLRVKVVDIFDVYDEFSYGIIDPLAIRNFLAYTYANWQPPAPLYVLLVGDGTYDPRDYQAYGDPIFIPPHLVPEVDPFIGETAADNRLVMIVGDDFIPDMALGRIPARTSAQVDLVVNKILGYEAAEPVPGWTNEVLFVADNQDAAGDFDNLSENIVPLLPSGYTAKKVYYGINYTNRTLAQQAVRNEVNQGVLLVNYIGHSGLTAWAAERLLDRAGVSLLTNFDMLAFFVPMTCMEGAYQYPTFLTADSVSLAERYLFHISGGAVGSWSPTGLGVATGHDFLNRRLYTAFFNDGIREVGLAALQADLYLLANSGGSYLDLLSTYLIFGDPALRLRIPPKLSVDDVTVSEGTGAPNAAEFTVTLSSPFEATVTVDYATSAGSATQGSDYALTSGTLTFAPNETRKTISVPVMHDLEDELDETFYVTLSNPVNAGIADGSGLGTIEDNDGPAISIADNSILEGDVGSASLVFTITLSAQSVQPVSVQYATSDDTATAGLDYTASSGTVTFDPGMTRQTIAVPVLGETLGEIDETFWVTLSQPVDAVIDQGLGVGTILNDDLPSISITDASLLEAPFGTLDMVFTVTLSAPGLQTITVNFTTSDESAAAGSDYDALSGTLTFAPGETQKTITVAIRGDTDTGEPDETFLVLLSDAVNANFLKFEGRGTILNAAYFYFFPFAFWPIGFIP